MRAVRVRAVTNIDLVRGKVGHSERESRTLSLIARPVCCVAGEGQRRAGATVMIVNHCVVRVCARATAIAKQSNRSLRLSIHRDQATEPETKPATEPMSPVDRTRRKWDDPMQRARSFGPRLHTV